MAWTQVVIIVLAVPALIPAEGIASNSSQATNGTSNISKSTIAYFSCDQSQRDHVSNMSADGRKYLKQFLMSHVSESNETSNSTFDSLNQTIMPVLDAAARCYGENRKTVLYRAGKYFMKFLQFSVKDNKLKDFVKSGGAECIRKTKNMTAKCVANATGWHSYEPEFRLIDLTTLQIAKKGCSQSKSIRNCVKGVLSYETKCSTEHINYVNSLFDYVSKHCSNSNHNVKTADDDAGSSKALIISLTCILTLTLVGVISYAVFVKLRSRLTKCHVVNYSKSGTVESPSNNNCA